MERDWSSVRRTGRSGVRHLFERGDIKYVMLDLLAEQPRHGYEIIRVLEERLGGLYAPSPGSVYPTLELLADMRCAEPREQEGRKVFAITDEGRQFLAEHDREVAGIRARMREWMSPSGRTEFGETRRELRALAHLLMRGRGQGDGDRLRRVHEIIARARGDVEAVLGEEKPT